jgi:hypothetical protein
MPPLIIPVAMVPAGPASDTMPKALLVLTVPDDGIDRTEWAPSLLTAHRYLSGKEWGPRWIALLDALTKHEWSFYHQEDDGNLPKMRSRPGEYGDWMKEHRLMRDYPISDDFGNELFQWWKELGPPTCWANVGDGEGQTKEPGRVRG